MTIDLIAFKDFITILMTIVVTAVASILAVRKAMTKWEKEGLDIERVSAEKSIIEALRVESERMFEQNQKLMEQLVSLQLRLGELHTSINKLKLEKDQLHEHIRQLTNEIKDLKS